jgi:superoxide dismutase, Cu-Zn family
MSYKMTRTLVSCLILTVIFVIGQPSAFAQGKPVKRKTVQLKDAQDNDVGMATIESKDTGVEVKLDLKGLPPGVHAVHFHQKAQCDPPDFKSAGGHFNPTSKQHGFDNPQGHHAGDMMNFTVKDNGTAKATVKDADVVLGDGSEANSLLANGGSSIMIHAKADDYKTDPAGNSGDRIACGAITP